VVYTNAVSFTATVKNPKCEKVLCHSGKAQPYRADMILNVLVVTVK